MKKLGSALLFGLALLACSGGGGSVGGSSAPLGQQGTASSAAGVEVTATIAAVSLGDDCGGGGGSFDAPSESAGKCADNQPCGSLCQQSNLQLTFKAAGGGEKARITITSVTLHDSGGTKVDTLTARAPLSWNGNGYVSWDQAIAPSTEVKASYSLSAPSWSTISSGTNTRSAKYLVRVVIQLDGGASIELESATVEREPDVAT